MSAIEQHDPIAHFVSNFIHVGTVERNIQSTVDSVINDIQRSWDFRKANHILGQYTRKFVLSNDGNFHFKENELDSQLQIRESGWAYWRQCNMHRDKEIRPCKYKKFIKESYLEITRIVNERVREHFSRHEEIRVTPVARATGYLIPENTCWPAVRNTRYVCAMIPVFGWIFLLNFPDGGGAIRGSHAGDIKIDMQISPERVC